MLRGDLTIEAYISELDSGFPEFERRLCIHLRELYHSGRRIEQVEPYVERLALIHDLFEEGKTPTHILEDPQLREVYLAEKKATGALITYYARSRNAPFEDVVKSVKTFARVDAHRLVLRDWLRARAIASSYRSGSEVFVEAGYIHQPLSHFLRRELDGQADVLTLNLLAPSIERLGGKKDGMAPGDRLTLHYASTSKMNESSINLLAAQSLIHIKLVRKEEHPSEEVSHIKDELRATQMVEALPYDQCRELFAQLRDESRERSLELVRAHLRRKKEVSDVL